MNNLDLTITQQCQQLLSTTATGAYLITEMSRYIDQRADYLADDYYSGLLEDDESDRFDAQVDLLEALRTEMYEVTEQRIRDINEINGGDMSDDDIERAAENEVYTS